MPLQKTIVKNLMNLLMIWSLQALQAYQIFLTVQEVHFLRISVYGQDAILLLPVQVK